MQTGRFGDAIVAAVDRTATAIEGTSTPMPTLAPEPEAFVSTEPEASVAPGVGIFSGLSFARPSNFDTIAFLVLIAVIVAVITAVLRRSTRDDD